MLYVNPVYYHALTEIAERNWEAMATETTDQGISESSEGLGRTIAEATARATLDIPNPIAPLAPETGHADECLTVSSVSTGPKSVSELCNDSRYSITEDEFTKYLDYSSDIAMAHSDNLGDESEDNQDGFKWTFSEAKSRLVSRVFINVRKALDEIADDPDIAIPNLSLVELRNELVRRVHQVDPEKQQTMLDASTALLDIPREVDMQSYNENILREQYDPIVKLQQEAFAEHGSFGALIYNESEDTRRVDMNWGIYNELVDATNFDHVPDTIQTPAGELGPEDTKSYEQVWQHHYLWHQLQDELLQARSQYRNHLIPALLSDIDGIEEIKQFRKQLRESEHAIGGQQQLLGSRDIRPRSVETHSIPDSVPYQEKLAKRDIEMQLNNTPLALLEFMRQRRQVTVDNWDIDSIDCPLCALLPDFCGEESCLYASTLEAFETQIPELLPDMISP